MAHLVGSLAAAFVVTLLGTPLVRILAIKVKAMDKPDGRKVHISLMPRMGGLAICLGFWIAVLLNQEITPAVCGLLTGGLVVCLVGIADDIWGISPRLKLLGQIMAACIAFYYGIRVDFLTNPFAGVFNLNAYYLNYFLTVLWIVGVTNAVNLIDGLDGLAAGVSAIAAVTMGIISLLERFSPEAAILAFILAASTLGFLKYNFHPARIFMGDTGSMFLGFNLSAIAIMGLTKGPTVISILLPVVILGIPILDTLFAILRRYTSGKPIFSPDKEHLHHRLLTLGLSHQKTVLAIYGVSVLLGLSAVITALVTTPQGVMIMLATTLGVFMAADRVGVLRSENASDRSKPKRAYNHISK